MTNKEKYRKFCEKEKDIPIFSKDWWLDSICGENAWDVLLVEKGGEIFASLPIYRKSEIIFEILTMPQLTQTMGIYINYPSKQKYYKRLSWEKDMMTALIQKIPKFDYFTQNFDKKVTNWLAFYWEGFEQTTFYTYVIENITLEDLEKNLETDIRRRRRKANEVGVEVVEGDDVEKFYELNMMTFKRQGRNIPYSLDFVKNLYKACRENNAVKMYFAKYEDNVISANFLVYDDNTVYYLMGGIHPDFKDLGGMDVVLYESIKFALENNKTFDFEGSMIESIEKYFRSFGAIQKPYFNITKTNSKLLKIRNFISDLKK
ncbi:FemAB family protein [Malaciobacter halophilus]|uniref:FemAB family protein n=1 Tax=Malaciobacter halophilus TaxID=197482 RepID=A0A2N1J5N4_9BACT|nr:GNAT family N-acetyltransferase [Malaciobacter halophilus]AXH09210.1 acetyltransferase [Malaciobacter halophilus]PKI81846.1 FemAB family protein [Malaciobacter halophilus]